MKKYQQIYDKYLVPLVVQLNKFLQNQCCCYLIILISLRSETREQIVLLYNRLL